MQHAAPPLQWRISSAPPPPSFPTPRHALELLDLRAMLCEALCQGQHAAVLDEAACDAAWMHGRGKGDRAATAALGERAHGRPRTHRAWPGTHYSALRSRQPCIAWLMAAQPSAWIALLFSLGWYVYGGVRCGRTDAATLSTHPTRRLARGHRRGSVREDRQLGTGAVLQGGHDRNKAVLVEAVAVEPGSGSADRCVRVCVSGVARTVPRRGVKSGNVLRTEAFGPARALPAPVPRRAKRWATRCPCRTACRPRVCRPRQPFRVRQRRLPPLPPPSARVRRCRTSRRLPRAGSASSRRPRS